MPAELDPATRIANLEIALAHHQRDYDSLNAVVTEQANQLDRLQRRMQQLTDRLQSMSSQEGQAQPRRLEDEKPPHY